MIAKERIDKLLVELGLADSRNRAQALVMAGVVLADDRRVEKPSEKINISATVRLKGASLETKYVGRRLKAGGRSKGIRDRSDRMGLHRHRGFNRRIYGLPATARGEADRRYRFRHKSARMVSSQRRES